MHCIRCNKTDAKHAGRGICMRCYLSDYRAKHGATIKAQQKAWTKRMGPEWAKLQRDLRNQRLGGFRAVVLQRDVHQCRHCGSKKALVVTALGPVRQPDNLISLCRRCAINLHRKTLLGNRAISYSRWWSVKHKLHACKCCGTSKTPHSAGGLCNTCDARLHRFHIAFEILESHYNAHGGACGICDFPVPLKQVSWDHIIALTNGGTHDISNLQPSHASCNSSKGNRTLEWARNRQKVRRAFICAAVKRPTTY
jgi:5-methylcytosine-specific restriction endonuclease McrA